MNRGDESKSMPFNEKLGQVFRNEGQEERRISYLCGWVTRFGKFLKPNRYHEAVASDIESFLRKLAGEGAGSWAVPAPLETSSPLQREPVAESVLIQRIGNRCDKGDLRDGAQEILELMRVKLRERHHSYRTEDTYLDWARRFLIFCGASSVDELSSEDVKAYLEFLAVKRKVSAATQNQAFNALLFLFSQTLGRSFGLIEGVTRAQARRRLPVVMRREEVKRLIAAMPDDYRLMTILLYGSGLRLMECLRLRIKEVDLEGRAIPP